jgi:hypothetical protein
MGPQSHSNGSASNSDSDPASASESPDTESTAATDAAVDEPSADRGTDSQTGRSAIERKADMDRDFVLIHRAASLDTFDRLDDPFSVEAKVARARGNGWLPFADRSMRDSQSTRADEDARNVIRLNQGKINAQTGFVMEFVDPELHRLSVFDIVAIPELKSWPVPESALASLPDGLRGTLYQQGYVKLQGRYDNDEQAFDDVQRGWAVTPDNRLDQLMRVIEALDGRLAPAVSVVVSEYGSERWRDPNSLAQAREIEADTVRAQIEEAEEAVPDSLLDGF